MLPAGTLSGAPKVRAMQIIDELEPVKRGGYGGAIGYVSYTGELDTCIHIRTVVVKDGVAHVQAGGGTVADAKPDYEYRESEAKARAVLQAIELAARQPDWPSGTALGRADADGRVGARDHAARGRLFAAPLAMRPPRGASRRRIPVRTRAAAARLLQRVETSGGPPELLGARADQERR